MHGQPYCKDGMQDETIKDVNIKLDRYAMSERQAISQDPNLTIAYTLGGIVQGRILICSQTILDLLAFLCIQIRRFDFRR